MKNRHNSNAISNINQEDAAECRLRPHGKRPECSRLFDRHVLSLDLAPRLLELGSHLTRCWKKTDSNPRSRLSRAARSAGSSHRLHRRGHWKLQLRLRPGRGPGAIRRERDFGARPHPIGEMRTPAHRPSKARRLSSSHSRPARTSISRRTYSYVMILQQNLPLLKRFAVAVALPGPSVDDLSALLGVFSREEAGLQRSLLEGDGFEPSVPRHIRRVWGGVVASVIVAHSAKRPTRSRPGTEISNPSPSCAESCANCHAWERTGLSARVWAAGLATGSTETRRVFRYRVNRGQYLCRAIFEYHGRMT